MRLFVQICVATCLGLLAAPPADGAEEPNDLILILDASNSMWGQIDGENKIVIARRAVGDLIDGLEDESRVGLVAYGHRREGDCDDIETLQPVGPLDKESLKTTINGVMPKGKTPITSSLDSAFAMIQDDRTTSVILISDGLETCSKDPCAAVREAKETGLPFVLHVVGFDVAGEDTSAARMCGTGRWRRVSGRRGRGDAVGRAGKRLRETVDARRPAGRDGYGERCVAGCLGRGARTQTVENGLRAGAPYVSAETNPRRISLEDGSYVATVTAVGISGTSRIEFAFGIADGNAVERSFDFSSGEIAVLVTRNGQLSDATVRVLEAGERTQIAAGRTYVAATSNPRVLTVPAGTYDVVVKSVELKGQTDHRVEGVVVTGGERTELQHDYASGGLRVTVKRDDALIDATVQVYDAEGRSVVGRRVYSDASRNPVSFELSPGQYLLKINEQRGERRELHAEVVASETVEVDFDFANP